MSFALKLLFAGITLPLAAQSPPVVDLDAQAKQLRTLLHSAQPLPLRMTELALRAPGADWSIGFVSSATVDRAGEIYLLQRGEKADPVLVVNREGRIVRSWGNGLYKIPHSIRIDPEGNVWTVDAGNSMIHKFTREGKHLLEINVGGLPVKPKSEFCGTTDITFGPGGRLFITDGYANTRVLEYSAAGKRIREWGKPGTGPGQFNVPHGITIDSENILYVADRENGRIQRFHMDGSYIGEWGNLGKTFSLTISPSGDLWIGTAPRNVPNGAEPWIAKVDRHTGRLLGAIASQGHHSIEISINGEAVTGARPDKVLWFKPIN